MRDFIILKGVGLVALPYNWLESDWERMILYSWIYFNHDIDSESD